MVLVSGTVLVSGAVLTNGCQREAWLANELRIHGQAPLPGLNSANRPCFRRGGALPIREDCPTPGPPRRKLRVSMKLSYMIDSRPFWRLENLSRSMAPELSSREKKRLE
ncbi:UNVERIFIED_CONTAM: hypothetical protein K2H54_056432 [Gekko kuhli]